MISKLSLEQKKNVEMKVKKMHKKLSAQLKKQKNQFHRRSLNVASKFREHASTAIIAALSFLIALAWKDLITKIFQENIKISSLERYPYLAELYSAILITFLAILAIMVVSKWVKKKNDVKIL